MMPLPAVAIVGFGRTRALPGLRLLSRDDPIGIWTFMNPHLKLGKGLGQNRKAPPESSQNKCELGE